MQLASEYENHMPAATSSIFTAISGLSLMLTAALQTLQSDGSLQTLLSVSTM
jgi:hypothetical protein